MLKNLSPLLNADLLYVLQSMGHGDELALVDRNYPAAATAQRLVRLDGADVIEAAEAILSVFPVDTFDDPPVFRMEVVGDRSAVPEVQREFHRAVMAAEGREVTLGSIERFDFYDRARQAYAVVATSEDRPYGRFIMIKGVIPAD